MLGAEHVTTLYNVHCCKDEGEKGYGGSKLRDWSAAWEERLTCPWCAGSLHAAVILHSWFPLPRKLLTFSPLHPAHNTDRLSLILSFRSLRMSPLLFFLSGIVIPSLPGIPYVFVFFPVRELRTFCFGLFISASRSVLSSTGATSHIELFKLQCQLITLKHNTNFSSSR